MIPNLDERDPLTKSFYGHTETQVEDIGEAKYSTGYYQDWFANWFKSKTLQLNKRWINWIRWDSQKRLIQLQRQSSKYNIGARLSRPNPNSSPMGYCQFHRFVNINVPYEVGKVCTTIRYYWTNEEVELVKNIICSEIIHKDWRVIKSWLIFIKQIILITDTDRMKISMLYYAYLIIY